MKSQWKKIRPGKMITVLLALAMLVPLLSMPDDALAKRGGDSGGRERFYGIIESMPAGGLHGTWVIGGRTLTTSAGTEFDQTEGPLAVNNCAKVDIRGGRVHEIDSEPMRDCR